VGVWVGNADNSPMKGTSGITGAGPIFHDAMLAATENIPERIFERPAGLVQKTVCRLSGLLPTPLCPHMIEEWFIEGTEPTEPDSIYQSFLIDTRNGLLANTKCDQTFTEPKGLAVFPREVEQWAREQGWPTPPTKESPLCGAQSPMEKPANRQSSWLEITHPQPNESYLLDPLIPDNQELVIFEAHASSDIQTIDWYVDGEKVGTAKAPDFRMKWKPEPGEITVTARANDLMEESYIAVLKR